MSRTRLTTPSASDLHRRWLMLTTTDGAFLSVPALKRVWPQGMPALDPGRRELLGDGRGDLEVAWDRWHTRRGDASTAGYRRVRDAFVDTVLREVVGWGELYRSGSAGVPEQARQVWSPDRTVAVDATGALRHPDEDAVGALVLVVDPVDALHDLVDDGWAASPLDRMETLLRASGVPIGVVTDGRWWGLVCARPDALVTSGVVDALTWTEEREVRDALVALLSLPRLLGGALGDRLPALFAESVAAAEEITEALGAQVRRAVELLVGAFSEAAVEARRHGATDPLPTDRGEVYAAAVTVMMRTVFLLFAEERALLPQSRLFTAGYGVSGELDALDQRVRDEGAEALDATALTWHRLLATSQALYAGSSFEDLRLPSYGGSLFDPDRFGFLLERDARGTLRVSVSDRVMREVLHAVQVAQLRGQPARRISFREVDVEQIGYVYEGLLGYSCVEATEVTLGLIGSSGAEPEIALTDLEAIVRRYADQARVAEVVLAQLKARQSGAKPATKAALTKALRESGQVEDADRALRAVTGDAALRERVRPLIGLVCRDLRERPVLVEPGGLLVVETPSRATAGAHYTPRKLAEEVVEHALAPLVYSPGPHSTGDRDAWRRIRSEDILALRVADIACGSGAFLVAAARYLAARLVEAWHEEGVGGGDPHALQVHALREVVARCLYGADINAMAVEMCKLSLWLVSLDPGLPFSFVDDKVLLGNSLLGLTDAEQLRALHIDPSRQTNAPSLLDLDVDALLRRAADRRRLLASEVSEYDPQRSATSKRRQYARIEESLAPLRAVADGVVAAGLVLGGKPGRALDAKCEALRLAVADAFPAEGDGDRTALDRVIADGLTPAVPTDYERWQPLHWILAVPDVMEHEGFDAIVGNPPFLGGQKLTGALGTNVRDWLVNLLAGGQRGSADLVAYFVLRAATLVKPTGTLGLIATNTLAQGDTREVGLDRLVADGFTITRAVQSRSWPVATANLEYAALWGTRAQVPAAAPRMANEEVVPRISTLLEPAGRVQGQPKRLAENAGIAFQGCIVLGMGFVVEPDEAAAWIEEDAPNAEVLFPYLNGEDLNSRPDSSASRWVIDFGTRPLAEAQRYRSPFARLHGTVRLERAKKPKAVSQSPWWLFLRARPALRSAMADLGEVLVIALVSKTVMPVRVSTGRVFSHKLGVFATASFADLSVLSSNLHQIWAIRYGSTMRADVNYSPSDVFLTFPRPEPTDWLDKVGRQLDAERREIMLRRQLGLTKLYNLINDPDVSDADEDVARLRAIHVELDTAVLDAYGWSDIDLGHGFHTYRQMQRWTVSPAARVEILDRLLEENHRRAASQGVVTAETQEDEDE